MKFVITEVSMPDINGFDIIMNLKRNINTSKIKYIFLSDLDELKEEDAGFLQALGIEKFLVKSNYSPNKLIKEIERAL